MRSCVQANTNIARGRGKLAFRLLAFGRASFSKTEQRPHTPPTCPTDNPGALDGLSKLHRSSLLTNSVALSRSDSFAPRSGRGGGDRSKKQHYRVARQQPPGAASSQPHRRIPRRNRTPSTARSHRHRSGRAVTPRQGPDPERFLPGHPFLGCARGPPLGRRETACERNSSEIPRGQVDPGKGERSGKCCPRRRRRWRRKWEHAALS